MDQNEPHHDEQEQDLEHQGHQEETRQLELLLALPEAHALHQAEDVDDDRSVDQDLDEGDVRSRWDGLSNDRQIGGVGHHHGCDGGDPVCKSKILEENGQADPP